MSAVEPRNFDVQFPLESVREAINKVATTRKTGITIVNKNDVFNTFTLNLGGLSLIEATIQIKRLGEAEVSVNIASTNAVRGSNHAATINGHIDTLINLISKVLSGEELTDEVIKESDKKGLSPVRVIAVSILIVAIVVLAISIISRI